MNSEMGCPPLPRCLLQPRPHPLQPGLPTPTPAHKPSSAALTPSRGQALLCSGQTGLHHFVRLIPPPEGFPDAAQPLG